MNWQDPWATMVWLSQRWTLHGDDAQAWIADHRWTLLLIAAVLMFVWVRDQKRQGKL